jgi:hypothetical protein
MAAYWTHLHWAVYVLAVLGAWRYVPLTVIRLVAAFTHNEQRHRQCMEVLYASRLGSSSIRVYKPNPDLLPRQAAPPQPGTIPPVHPVPPGQSNV